MANHGAEFLPKDALRCKIPGELTTSAPWRSPLQTSIFAYMYIHMHIYLYMFVIIDMCMYSLFHGSLSVQHTDSVHDLRMSLSLYIYEHTHICNYIHTYLPTYVRTYVHMCIHMFLHMYTYIHISTYTCMFTSFANIAVHRVQIGR